MRQLEKCAGITKALPIPGKVKIYIYNRNPSKRAMPYITAAIFRLRVARRVTRIVPQERSRNRRK